MNVGQNIRRIRKAKGLTLEAVALAVGTDTGNLSRIERGLQNYTDDGLKRIAKALGVPVKSLFDDSPESSLLSNLRLQNADREPRNGLLVPVISWVQAGAWGSIVDLFQPGDAEDWVPCPVKHGPRTFVLRVRGISMQNRGDDLSFSEGELIYVDPDVPAENRKCVVARLGDGDEATFKQLIIENERRYLKALNPAWPEPIIPLPENSTILGVVIGKWSDVS